MQLKQSGFGRLPDAAPMLRLHLVFQACEDGNAGSSLGLHDLEVKERHTRMAATAVAKRRTQFEVGTMFRLVGLHGCRLRFLGKVVATMFMGMIGLVKAGEQRQDENPDSHECLQRLHPTNVSLEWQNCKARPVGYLLSPLTGFLAEVRHYRNASHR